VSARSRGTQGGNFAKVVASGEGGECSWRENLQRDYSRARQISEDEMAVTAVIDTRFLLTMQFPPDEGTKKSVELLFNKELSSGLIAPSIVLTEFIKFAGPKIGEDAVFSRINLFKDRGMKVVPLSETICINAGKLLLEKRNTPIADALIASFVKLREAQYVITDDPDYEELGVKTRKW
jgi:predicted nucleic acid-binding protein